MSGDEDSLQLLGWDAEFARSFEELNAPEKLVPGRVVGDARGSYLVRAAALDGDGLADYSAIMRGKLHDSTAAEPIAGDWVGLYRDESGTAVIETLVPRRTGFVRKVPGERSVEQTVAANVDVVFLVQGLDGDFNVRRTERYLVAAYDSGARPVIVLTKADLLSAPELEERLAATAAVAPGVRLIALSSLAPEAGLEELRSSLTPGHTYACLGSSGAGKSTLINALLGAEVQDTQAVRSGDDRGKHTTTARRLLVTDSGALLLDTPGLRELQLWSTTDGGIDQVFEDIEALGADCRFRDCLHEQEPGCAVREKIESGELPADRLASFRKLKAELARLESRADPRAAQEERHREKRTHKYYRGVQKAKRQRQGRE